MSNVSTCLWLEKDGEAAVRFYVYLLPNDSLKHISTRRNLGQAAARATFSC
jgi:predicted 3-demethylubiquinone-9 3-methyltransferase (glyoxalase superfamily)